MCVDAHHSGVVGNLRVTAGLDGTCWKSPFANTEQNTHGTLKN